MKKIEVNASTCIACGACYQIAPEAFQPNESGISVPVKELVEEVDALTIEAMESCPVSAITIEDVEDEY